MPQPIATAPTDGTVILTDCGFCVYIDRWGSPVYNGWAASDPFGETYKCADNGRWYCHPTQWEPVPSWILNR